MVFIHLKIHQPEKNHVFMNSLKLLLPLTVCCSLWLYSIAPAAAQTVVGLRAIEQKKPLEQLEVQKISEDSLSSTFLIWIKKEVPAHYHAQHDEQVYILEGEAEMLLGGKRLKVKAGDFVAIPKNTLHAVRVVSVVPLKVLSIQTPRFDGSDRMLVKQE